ncbi:hypothetical protein EDD17DRAFT_1671634 [Pisolithus thermaeus]|nr:hypothetical protein EDD17DRAFT_1671634 [Pisolithus thermaeus]
MLLRESLLDGSWIRFALLYHENSRFYSAVWSEPNKEVGHALPHITIEMPVYKESLEQTMCVFCSLEVLLLLSMMTVCNSSPKTGALNVYSSPGGFKRAGRFKKASDVNHGLDPSLKPERHLKALEEAEERGDLQVFGEEPLEERALRMACDEVFEESNGKWKPRASNGRSIRIEEIILLVDSDTIVPEDCLRDAARELTESPEVAIIQHKSAHHYFENGIAHFTRRINRAISLLPFRWPRPLFQQTAKEDMLKGYIIRWATYSDGGFKKGFSLTVDDELNRRPKYSYGCSELTFNPLISWWRLGPVNKQLRTFVWSDASVHYKFTMMSCA